MRNMILLFIGFTFVACGLPKGFSKNDLKKMNYEEVVSIAYNNDVLPDQYPMYPDGEKGYFQAVAREIVYPPSLKVNGTHGTVEVVFMVNKKGKITDAHVVKSLHPTLDAEAIRVIEAVNDWFPARFQGEYTDVQMKMTVYFDPSVE